MKVDLQIVAIAIAILVLFPVFVWQCWIQFQAWRNIGKPPAKPETRPRR